MIIFVIIVAVILISITARDRSKPQSAQSAQVESMQDSGGRIHHKLQIESGKERNYILVVGPNQYLNLTLSGAQESPAKYEVSYLSDNLSLQTAAANWLMFETNNYPWIGTLMVDAVSPSGSKSLAAYITVVVVPGRTEASLVEFPNQMPSELPPAFPPSSAQESQACRGTDRSFVIERGKMYVAAAAPGQVLNLRFKAEPNHEWPNVEFPPDLLHSLGSFPCDRGEYICPFIVGSEQYSGWGWCNYAGKNGGKSDCSFVMVLPMPGWSEPVVWSARPTTDRLKPFDYTELPVDKPPSADASNVFPNGPAQYGHFYSNHCSTGNSDDYFGYYCHSNKGSGQGSDRGSGSHPGNDYSASSSSNSRTASSKPGSRSSSSGYSNFMRDVGYGSSGGFEIPRTQYRNGSVTSSYRGQPGGRGARSGSYSPPRGGGGGMTSNIPRSDKAWSKSSYTVGGGKRYGGYGGGRRRR